MDRNGQSVPPPQSLDAAIEKASRYYVGRCDFNAYPRPRWSVLSAGDTGELYYVTLSGRVAPRNNWWDRLDCTCAASVKGLRVCWHKAAAYLHYLDAQKECDYHAHR